MATFHHSWTSCHHFSQSFQIRQNRLIRPCLFLASTSVDWMFIEINLKIMKYLAVQLFVDDSDFSDALPDYSLIWMTMFQGRHHKILNQLSHKGQLFLDPNEKEPELWRKFDVLLLSSFWIELFIWRAVIFTYWKILR